MNTQLYKSCQSNDYERVRNLTKRPYNRKTIIKSLEIAIKNNSVNALVIMLEYITQLDMHEILYLMHLAYDICNNMFMFKKIMIECKYSKFQWIPLEFLINDYSKLNKRYQLLSVINDHYTIDDYYKDRIKSILISLIHDIDLHSYIHDIKLFTFEDEKEIFNELVIYKHTDPDIIRFYMKIGHEAELEKVSKRLRFLFI